MGIARGAAGCHSRDVGLPGRRARVIAAVSVAASLLAAGHAQAGRPSISIFEFPGKIHGKIHTDGTLTVGQQETLTVTKLPGKFRLQGFVSPPPTATECQQFNAVFCESEPLFRIPGTPRFRSSKKGRAALTFVMPPGYQVTNFKDPLKSHPVYFINGQTAHIDVFVTYRERRHGRLAEITSVADSAIAVVEVPPPAP